MKIAQIIVLSNKGNLTKGNLNLQFLKENSLAILFHRDLTSQVTIKKKRALIRHKSDDLTNLLAIQKVVLNKRLQP